MRYTLTVLCLLIFVSQSYSQIKDSDNTIATDTSFNINAISSKTLSRLQVGYSALGNIIQRRTEKLLKRLQKKEAKLKKYIAEKDSSKAKEIFPGHNATYEELQSKIQQAVDPANASPLKEYSPHIDSFQAALSFLQQKNSNLPAQKSAQLQNVNDQLQQLQVKLQQADAVQSFVAQREQQLKDQLSQYGNNIRSQLIGINKEAWYYQQQIGEYKSMLKDKDKLKQKAIAAVEGLPAFKNFIQTNSYLSQLFPTVQSSSATQALAGLQTTAQVQAMVQQLGIPAVNNATGVPAIYNPQQYIDQQLQIAQAQLNMLKDKLNNLGQTSGSSNMVMPDFTPNNQKTKTFLKRLEYGFNIQSQKNNYYLPVTSELALTLGYKLNDKSTIGAGISYNVGWGNPIKNIHFSSQGISIRSFIDIKAKGSIWITGGWEYDYLQQFAKLSDIKNLVVWQKSALVGVTKKYKIGKKAGNIQLLYDFLSNDHVPKTSPLVYRMGYNF